MIADAGKKNVLARDQKREMNTFHQNDDRLSRRSGIRDCISLRLVDEWQGTMTILHVRHASVVGGRADQSQQHGEEDLQQKTRQAPVETSIT